jgi:PBP1b-binding outer membrane lipoprotein LpoB
VSPAEIGDNMSRTLSIATLAVILTACSEGATEASFVSEATASPPVTTPDYGWRTDISPNAEQDGMVKDYD